MTPTENATCSKCGVDLGIRGSAHLTFFCRPCFSETVKEID